jgi:hypothetical protein
MVSSALDMELDELLATLERLGATYTADPEYAELRSALPRDWPL